MAWFKELYPDLADVAWSSSGVIHPIEDYGFYDYQAYTTFNYYSPSAVKAIEAYEKEIYDHYTSGEDFQKFKKETLNYQASDRDLFDDLSWFIGTTQQGRAK